MFDALKTFFRRADAFLQKVSKFYKASAENPLRIRTTGDEPVLVMSLQSSIESVCESRRTHRCKVSDAVRLAECKILIGHAPPFA